MKNNQTYIKHIVEAIEKIKEYLEEESFKSFAKNSLKIDGVVRQLEIIGEASSKIDIKFRKRYKDIPWRKIIDMRNRLIHDYFGVDVKIVWDTCKKDLSKLKKILKSWL